MVSGVITCSIWSSNCCWSAASNSPYGAQSAFRTLTNESNVYYPFMNCFRSLLIHWQYQHQHFSKRPEPFFFFSKMDFFQCSIHVKLVINFSWIDSRNPKKSCVKKVHRLTKVTVVPLLSNFLHHSYSSFYKNEPLDSYRTMVNREGNIRIERDGVSFETFFSSSLLRLTCQKRCEKCTQKGLFMNFRRDLFSLNERNGWVMPFFFHPLRPTIGMKHFLLQVIFTVK